MAADKDITILQGSALNLPVRWMDGDRIIRKPITGISIASGAPRLDVAGHGCPNGWPTTVTLVKGMTPINAKNAEPKGADYDKFCAVAGNRTWTLMVYLNEPAAGGATRFTKIGKTVQPETGKLLAWNNRITPDRFNPASIHHGMKVRSGVKHVITKWYRERPWG